jgi:hypothetical protein
VRSPTSQRSKRKGRGVSIKTADVEHSSASVQTEKDPSAHFLERLRANSGYIRLTQIEGYGAGRRQRLEETCWRLYCARHRYEITGARAERALARLDALRQSLGDPCWVPETIAMSLNLLQKDLRHLASIGRRGRPTDKIGRLFRKNMHVFVPLAHLSQRTARFLQREEIDEILGELSELVCGGRISAESITRMRMRERSRAKLNSSTASTTAENLRPLND